MELSEAPISNMKLILSFLTFLNSFPKFRVSTGFSLNNCDLRIRKHRIIFLKNQIAPKIFKKLYLTIFTLKKNYFHIQIATYFFQFCILTLYLNRCSITLGMM